MRDCFIKFMAIKFTFIFKCSTQIQYSNPLGLINFSIKYLISLKKNEIKTNYTTRLQFYRNVKIIF